MEDFDDFLGLNGGDWGALANGVVGDFDASAFSSEENDAAFTMDLEGLENSFTSATTTSTTTRSLPRRKTVKAKRVSSEAAAAPSSSSRGGGGAKLRQQPVTSPDAVANDAASAAALALRRGSEHLLTGLTAQSLSAFRSAFFGSLSDDEGDGEGGDDDDDDDAVGNNKKRKRAKRHNPDSELIASATEEQMRLLNLESKSKEGKRNRRRIRNRMSALLHRERKKMYIEALESMVQEKDNRIKQLEQMVAGHAASSFSAASFSASSSSSSSSLAATDDDSLASSSNPSTRSGSPVPPSPMGSSAGGGASRGAVVQVASGLRSLFPMLSVVALVCVAMFDGRIGPPGSQDASLVALVASSPRSVYQQMQQAETMTPLSLLPAPALVAATPTLHLSASTPLLQQQGRRRLLDWDSGPAALDSLGELSDVSGLGAGGHNATGPDLLSTLSRAKQGLWRYSHRVATLYPRLTAEMLRNQSHASTVGAGQPKRNLRSRGSTAAPPSVVATAASPSARAVATSKGLVSASAAAQHLLPVLAQHYASEPVPPVVPLARVATVNRVLMTTGKALLDPALTVTVATAMGHDDEVRAKHHHSQPHASSPASSALSAWRGPPVPVPEADQAGGAKPVIFSPAADSQVLVMLLPASSIRWGKAWADSAEGTTEALLNTFNNATDAPHGAGGPDETGQMWVEIGCSVFKIQVVKNVTMA